MPFSDSLVCCITDKNETRRDAAGSKNCGPGILKTMMYALKADKRTKKISKESNVAGHRKVDAIEKEKRVLGRNGGDVQRLAK